MSCLDETICVYNEPFERINCNFTIGYLHYMCNHINTCKRSDNLYDCCASDITDCVIETLDVNLLPTIQPSIASSITSLCMTTCNIMPSANKCYWYESQNMDISCIENNKYCCSHIRNECCQTTGIYIYIVIGLLFFVMMLMIGMVGYRYTILMYRRVTPESPIGKNHVKDNYPTLVIDI